MEELVVKCTECAKDFRISWSGVNHEPIQCPNCSLKLNKNLSARSILFRLFQHRNHALRIRTEFRILFSYPFTSFLFQVFVTPCYNDIIPHLTAVVNTKIEF